MKWFKFIIYCQLFLTVVTSGYNAISFFLGLQYGSTSDAALVYAYYGNALKIMDILFGIIYIVAGVLAIITRQKLAHFKKKAPNWYIALLFYTLAANIFYLIIATILTGIPLLDARTVGNIIGTGIMIALNWVYFKKRSSLFIND